MDRAELEQQAERAIRRGELKEALEQYELLANQFPHDARLADRIHQLRQSLQPAELTGGSAPAAAPSAPDLRPSTPEREGERLFGIGDYAGAAAAYRRAVAEKPDNPLVRERLDELYRLARSAPAHSPTDRALPADKPGLLQALLDRISSRRRLTPNRPGSSG